MVKALVHGKGKNVQSGVLRRYVVRLCAVENMLNVGLDYGRGYSDLV